MNIPIILNVLRPGAQWIADPDTYAGLRMLGDATKPTLEEMTAVQATLDSARDAALTIKEALRAALLEFSAGERLAFGAGIQAVSAALDAGDVAVAREIVETYPGVPDLLRAQLAACFQV